ncbi:hypothetical protein SAMN06297144_2701 [Sphingomonas guangdongensis]|uniref:TadE-like protein n=1 Tax=Sphingomonas guangdongensis TaxID=1141890 RepID=A0A285R1F7_9SPHN|nr:pilus assembly protein [Sphingomonas guangdongensis]SOB87569.1 hypothetical protein SAMN06297144_2701 [Sphingomonas guangdongensis]
MIARLRTTLGRLRDDRRGLALLEFAFYLPIFLTMCLMGTELMNYIITRQRISQIALHLSDNAARMGAGTMLQAKTISETDINDVLTGAGWQSGDLDLFKNGRVIISSVEPMARPNLTNRYKIGWQRCRGDKTTHVSGFGVAGQPSGTNMDGVGPAGMKVTAPEDGGTMFVEVFYEYQPIIKTSLSPSQTMTEVASMMIRDRRDMTQIYNVENATRSTC